MTLKTWILPFLLVPGLNGAADSNAPIEIYQQ